MKWVMVVLYLLVAVLNFTVSTLYFSEGKDVFGALWAVTAGLWFGGAIIWAIFARED